MTALAIASTFLTQNFAWAVCSDGLPFPPGQQGYVNTLLPPSLANMSPNIFTGTAGSVWVPDNSTFEGNDPTTGTSTIALNGSGITGLPVAPVGGHDWVMDQGSTTCKETYTGTPGAAPSGWTIPPNTTTDCFVLPVVKILNGQVVFQNFGVIPLQNQTIVFTCDPTALPVTPLTPNPANTRLNQIGCALVRLQTGTFQAVDQTTGPAYMVTASIMGGLFTQRLDNTPNTAPGDAGRVISELRYFADIPVGTKLTNAIVSPDGHYVGATSIRRNPNLFVCNMPYGDPGRIDSPPVDFATFANSFDTSPQNPAGVKCLTSVATTGLQVTLSNVWGPDNQPYLGGQRTITTAGSAGAAPGSFFLPGAWPQCIVQGKGQTITLPAVFPVETSPSADPQSALFGNYNNVAVLDAAIKAVFSAHSNGGCGTFGANAGFSASPVVQPQTMAGYTASNGNKYLFSAGVGQPTVQARVNQNADGTSHYSIRTYFSNGNGFTTGIGIAPSMNFTTVGSVNTAGAPTPSPGATGSGSLIVMTDPTGLGLAGQEIMSRLPLCEDF